MSLTRTELRALDQRSRWLELLAKQLRERGLWVQLGRIDSTDRERRDWVHALRVEDGTVTASADQKDVWSIQFDGASVGSSADLPAVVDTITSRLLV